MKSCLTFLFFLLFIAFVNGQDKPPKNPDNVGVAEFDTFKNNSFEIMNQSIRADSDIMRIDNEVKTYAGVMSQVNKDKLTKNYKAIMELNKYRKTLVTRVGELDDQGKAVLSSAKSFSPKTKSLTAVSNTNKALKALDLSRKHLTNSAVLMKSNAEILSKELATRGEKVEPFVE
jgi:hypothetical protein